MAEVLKRVCKAEDGKWYQWDPEKKKWYFWDPINERRLAGKPRENLPQASEKGLTARGRPRQRATSPDRAKTRSDSEKVYRTTQTRKRRNHENLNRAIRERERELAKVEEEITVAEKLQELIAKAPSVRDQRKAILALFLEKGFSPIAEMIDMLQNPEKSSMLRMADKLAILRTLSEFEAAKPKTVDIDGEINSTMTINVIDYSTASQRQLKAADKITRDTAGEVLELTDEDYDEFESEVS